MRRQFAPAALTGLALVALAGLPAAAEGDDPATTSAVGPEIDPKAYAGLWYEMARTPTPFEQRCVGGVTARYGVEDGGDVTVVNRCDLPGGETSRVEGTATVVGDGFRRLNVDFPQSPEESGANYVIEAVGPKVDGEYAWAVVRGPGEGYGWILARSLDLDAEAREAAEQAFADAGLDRTRLEDTAQPPLTYEPGAE